MTTHARIGMWETNSSTVNQLVIPRTRLKRPEKPLIIRAVDKYIDSPDGLDPQGRLDWLVKCCGFDKLNWPMFLANALKRLEWDFEVDYESFVSNAVTCWETDEIAETIINKCNEEGNYTIIEDLLLRPDVRLDKINNSLWYEDEANYRENDGPEQTVVIYES